MAIGIPKVVFVGTVALSVGGIAVGNFLIPNSKAEKSPNAQSKLSSFEDFTSQEKSKEETNEVQVCQIYEAISPSQQGSPKVSSIKHKGDKDKFLKTVTRDWDSGFKGEVENQCQKLISSKKKLNIYVWEGERTRGSSEKKWIYSSWLQDDDWITTAQIISDPQP